jgi:hypothetical protein
VRAKCFDMRDCCLRRDRLINSGCCQLGAVEADQNSFRGRRFGAEDGILDARWVPASAPAIPALVRRFAANRRSDLALFSKNHGRMRKSWNIFFGPAFLVTVERGGRPNSRRLG